VPRPATATVLPELLRPGPRDDALSEAGRGDVPGERLGTARGFGLTQWMGAIQDARAHCHVFFPWYNTEHHHSGLGLLTPADVHHGLTEQRIAARATVLAAAYAAHPE